MHLLRISSFTQPVAEAFHFKSGRLAFSVHVRYEVYQEKVIYFAFKNFGFSNIVIIQ